MSAVAACLLWLNGGAGAAGVAHTRKQLARRQPARAAGNGACCVIDGR